MNFPCLVCKFEVITDANECSLCENWLHLKCAKLSKKELNKLSNTECEWYCYKCDSIFPFRNVSNDDFYDPSNEVGGSYVFALSVRPPSVRGVKKKYGLKTRFRGF